MNEKQSILNGCQLKLLNGCQLKLPSDLLVCLFTAATAITAIRVTPVDM